MRLSKRAYARFGDIYAYGRNRFGKTQADKFLPGLLAAIAKIPVHGISKPIPAEYGVNGFYFLHPPYFIYWKHLANDDVGIVTILHERMQLNARFEDNK